MDRSGEENGAPAKPIRLAVGVLLIKQIEGLPDEKLVLHIQENPYLQYFCGIKEFGYNIPFEPSLMVAFRKRFDEKVGREINEMLFKPQRDNKDKPEPPNYSLKGR